MKIPFLERRGASRTQRDNHVMTWMKKPEWLWLLIGGTSGLLLGIILVSLFSGNQVSSDKASSAESVSGTKAAEVPEPVFDFYTVLPESEGGGTKKLKTIEGFDNQPASGNESPDSVTTTPAASEHASSKKTTGDEQKASHGTSEISDNLATTASGHEKTSVDISTADVHSQVTENAQTAERQDNSAKTLEPAVASDGHYLLQTGSFRRLDDADRMRARLLLLGLKPQIKKVQISNGEYWHRVQLGPFDSVSDLQPVKTLLVNKKMDTLVLKIR